MRAALYARVSTEEQVEGYSIDAQRRAFQSLIESRGWLPAGEYVDEGKSARNEDISKRPRFKDMIADALEGKFDVVIVHKIDRFSRRQRVTLEYLDKLGRAGVGFLSISEQFDYTAPWGKFALSMLAALAELYSDNLSQETKKGWAERRAQGLYCGLLPFGAMRGSDGVPVPNPETHPGLIMAFGLTAEGVTGPEVARALNAKGYRTAGNQGNRLFSKDTVRGMLNNSFYVGYLPDGNSEWLKGKHDALIPQELWDRAQKMRRRNKRATHSSCPSTKSVSSLTGIAYCWHCKGRIHVVCTVKGEGRLGCYNRTKGWDCPQPSAAVRVYEEQIGAYLQTFHIPEDYQQKILEAQQKLQATYNDNGRERSRLEGQLKRAKELYELGDYSKQEYLQRRDTIQRELRVLSPSPNGPEHLERLAGFLANVGDAWAVAGQEQRNKLARCLFEEVWLKGIEVVAVKPRPEFEPFFEMNYRQFVTRNIELATPRGFEPPISTVTGWHVSPLHHGAAQIYAGTPAESL